MAELKTYTLQEVADILKVARQTVYNWKNDGSLKVISLGREYRVTEETLRDILEHGHQPAQK